MNRLNIGIVHIRRPVLDHGTSLHPAQHGWLDVGQFISEVAPFDDAHAVSKTISAHVMRGNERTRKPARHRCRLRSV
jgi:hypothetical protein